MQANELRKKFIEFFTDREHERMPAVSLVPENDPSVLFTTAGMQQFKKYYIKPESSPAKNIVTIQPALRTSDIDEVGDKSHFTFFEMLGNFSFGGYGKKETIKWAIEFLESLGLSKKDFVGHYFKGDDKADADFESVKILEELGINKEGYGRDETFWGPTGNEGPCGPSVELFNKDLEVWTLVFNQYFQSSDKKFSEFKSLGVDTGAGLERLLMVVNGEKDIYKTDLFEPVISEIEQLSRAKYDDNKKAFRIISDHIRAGVFLLADGITPSNIGQGYVLRRLIRRLIRYWRLVGGEGPVVADLATEIIENYKEAYPYLEEKEQVIIDELQKEEEKFSQTLNRGLKEFEKMIEADKFSGEDAFKLYESYGFPLEMTEELLKEKNISINKQEFDEAFKEHQEKSRTSSTGQFKGGLVGETEVTTKMHTATHLLLKALQDVLGGDVHQKGSNINEERIRFDFSYPKALTAEEIKKVEDIVNEKIEADLPVIKKEATVEEAKAMGAEASFIEKYKSLGKNLTLYSIDDYSHELCGGPHVESTGKVGNFKITKEESSSAGVRRIKAILE